MHTAGVTLRASSITLQQAGSAFVASLTDAGRRPNTIKSYRIAVGQLGRYLGAPAVPVRLAELTPERVSGFLEYLLTTHEPGSVATRFDALKVVFDWLVEEGALEASALRVHRPAVRPTPRVATILARLVPASPPPLPPGPPRDPTRPPDYSAYGRRGGLIAFARHGSDLSLPARRAFLDRFEAAVDPTFSLTPEDRHRRARALLRAHMLQLSERSVNVCRARATPGDGPSLG